MVIIYIYGCIEIFYWDIECFLFWGKICTISYISTNCATTLTSNVYWRLTECQSIYGCMYEEILWHITQHSILQCSLSWSLLETCYVEPIPLRKPLKHCIPFPRKTRPNHPNARKNVSFGKKDQNTYHSTLSIFPFLKRFMAAVNLQVWLDYWLVTPLVITTWLRANLCHMTRFLSA